MDMDWRHRADNRRQVLHSSVIVWLSFNHLDIFWAALFGHLWISKILIFYRMEASLSRRTFRLFRNTAHLVLRDASGVTS